MMELIGNRNEGSLRRSLGQDCVIKPPWTLADLLQLLNKHWIAVFGHVFKRSIKTTVEDLQKHFSGGGGSPGCLANALIILDQARTLFEVIAARSSYNGSITKSQLSVRLSLGIPSHGRLLMKLNKRTHQGSLKKVQKKSGSVHEINTAQADNNPHALVLSTFETIWNAVNQFSAQIFNGVGFPHPVPLGFLEDLAKPTRDEAIQFLSRLCSCLAFVVTAIQSVLQEPKGSEAGSIQLFETLLQAITQFFQQILSMNTHVTVSELFRFARDPNARMGLIQGCSQLDRALATLQQCSNWVVSSEQ
ncbi:RNA endoribonuclease [Desmophyllum pertusum]|uniref:RNA endoribonuclease n=1 Tax=Desmophyllum pertusum TaxID=174260 RepID=A0A9X0CW02_9CNID|nr:RNA endoribonuclease [Desmophyllum pertusum]